MTHELHIVTELSQIRMDTLTPRIWLLTGERNSGKTTRLRDWIRNQQHVRIVTGVVSDKVVEENILVGYDLVTLPSNTSYPVIRRRAFPRSFAAGKFFFDADGFDQINTSLVRAAVGDITVLDEIGPAEMQQGKGLLPALEYFLQLRVPLLLVVREHFIENVQQFCNDRSQTRPVRQHF